MRLRRMTATLVGVVALSGCATPPRDQGFSDVAAAVQERTGQTVTWHQTGPDDAAVTHHVHALLAAELTPESAVRIVLLNNPRLHATYQALGVSQADLVQAGLLRNPTLVAGVTFFSAGPQVELSLVQNLVQVFALPARFLSRVVMPLKTTIVRESQLHHNGMLMSPFQLLEAKRQEIESAAQYIEALERFWVERSVLDQTLSGRMTSRDAASVPLMKRTAS